MLTASLSTKGQVVIPAALRREMGIGPGDAVAFERTGDGQSVTIRKAESLREMSQRLSRHIKPGTPPLADVHELYRTRAPRH
jgi:AbrB family looped-hinge helix DNA binding protein